VTALTVESPREVRGLLPRARRASCRDAGPRAARLARPAGGRA
jgi:hypothetical protein